MKSFKIFSVAVTAALCMTVSLQAQNADALPGPSNLQRNQGLGIAPGYLANTRLRANDSMSKVMNDLRDAESDEEKQAAQDAVKVELEKQYDVYLAQNEKQLQQLEDRLVKLRAQLEKRKEAKDKLVDLRLQMMISEADGLGWPGGNMRNNSSINLTPYDRINPLDPFAPSSTIQPRWPSNVPVARPNSQRQTPARPDRAASPKSGR